jgi:hypothetical protein
VTLKALRAALAALEIDENTEVQVLSGGEGFAVNGVTAEYYDGRHSLWLLTSEG